MKITKIALLLSFVLVVALAFSSCGDTKGTEGLEFYPLPDGTYGVMVGNDLYMDKIVIPAKYNGKPVTQILPSAFENAVNLTEIVIPNSITSISDYAFSQCKSLTSVVIGDSVTYIGNFAFRDCSSLTSVVIPDSVTSIGKDAFSGCSSLTSITIPDSVTSIGDNAFCDCSSLTSITISDSVTSIGSYAFHGCSGLTNVEFKDPNGWYRDSYSISSSDLDNASTAAQYLRSTYKSYTWTKE